MRRVTVYDVGQFTVIEVDGDLDLIAAHDLRHALGAVLATTTGNVNLDLSKVATVDQAGIAALGWCSHQAIASRRRLLWTGCSRPLLAHLTADNAARARDAATATRR